MVDLDFAPPPPPKFLSEKSDKEFKESKDKPIEKELVKEIPAVESEKKEGFFSKVFKKKETETVGKSVEQPIGEAEKKLNLEDVRAKYNIPSKEEKIEKKAVDVKKWDNGDIVEEYQEPTSKSPRWDTPVHKADHIHGEISSEEEIDVSKMPQRKSHRKMGERMTGVKIKGKRRSPVNKAIDDYFKKVEREQLLIQKELERIVTHPKKSLKKKSKEYLIHHNEKLIKSMKQLLATIKTIDDVKFQKSVQGNKKAFQKWISGILELEKKAENKRNQIMQKKIIQMFKVYRDGLNKDLDDKKYSISEQKKNADKQIKQAEDERTNIGTQKEKIKKDIADLKEKQSKFTNLIEDKISKIMPSKVKKEKNSLMKTEDKLKKLVEEYAPKAEKLKADIEKLKLDKAEAKQLLKDSDLLKKTKEQLERKELKLKKEIENLKLKDSELEEKTNNLENLEKNLKKRESSLKASITKLKNKEENLLVRDRELKIEVKDLETRKKGFDLRESEVKEMETFIVGERQDLKGIKDDVLFREAEARNKLEETKEIAKEIRREEMKIISEGRKLDSLGFEKYLHEKPEKPEKSTLINPELEDFNKKISLCRDMISNSQLVDAKKLYNDIRQGFTRTNINPSQKEIIFNSIRELYDDIYLGLISNY